jgi:acyl carrier protein
MGLDTVELVMAIEETFGLTIPDDRAGKIVTIGDAYRCILERLEFPESPGSCLSAGAFYHLRRTLMRQAGTSRAAVRPGARLETLLADSDRRRSWVGLGESLGWRLPRLERPPWVVAASVLAVLALAGALAAGPVLLGFPGPSIDLGIVIFLVSCPLAALTAWYETRPLATRIPAECSTVRGLIATVTTTNYATLARRRGGWDREEVRAVLFRLVAEQAGVPRERLTEDTRFVADLGMD